MESERALLLIDGGYLDFIQRGLGNVRVDYGKMSTELCAQFGFKLSRAVYFNCLPHLSSTPTDAEKEAYSKKKNFYDRLSKLDRFEVKLGELVYRGKDELTGRPVYEQKQVDVMLASDMVYAAAKKSVDAIILLSGDGDFVPAVKLAKTEGIIVALAHGQRSGNDTVQDALWSLCDLRFNLGSEFFSKITR